MERRFLAAIDAAVDRALPAGWPRLPRKWLPARGSVKSRHAFRLANDARPAPYLAIVAFPAFAIRTAAVECDLAALVDHILARGATLLLLYEHESDPSGWVREHLDFPHPRLLCLPCAPPRSAPRTPLARRSAGAGSAAGGAGHDDAGGGGVGNDFHQGNDVDDGNHGTDGSKAGDDYTAAPTYNREEPLSDVIRGLWSGDLFYRGPSEGVQTILVEIMKCTCWRCHFTLDVVTGIVFPDCEVADGSLPHWTYYQALLPLSRIPDPIIPALSAAVEAWRAAGDRRLTVIRWRYSKTVGYAYWAAECTACGSFQGDFPVMEERMQWLEDLGSRREGILSYRPLHLDVPRQALRELTWGAEVNPHARFLGWYRAGDPELERSPEALPVDHVSQAAAAADRPQGADGLAGDATRDRAAAMDGPAGASGPDRTAGIIGRADSSGPDLGAATRIGPAAEPSPEVTAGADLGVLAAPAADNAAALRLGPLRRLGEILSAWLGWMGARQQPLEPPGTEASDGSPAALPSPPPPAPSARSATGR